MLLESFLFQWCVSVHGFQVNRLCIYTSIKIHNYVQQGMREATSKYEWQMVLQKLISSVVIFLIQYGGLESCFKLISYSFSHGTGKVLMVLNWWVRAKNRSQSHLQWATSALGHRSYMRARWHSN